MEFSPEATTILERELARLSAHRATLAAEVAAIDERLAALALVLGHKASQKPLPAQQRTGPSRVPAMAQTVLREDGGLMHYRALAACVEARGVHIPGKNKGNTLNAHMSRRKDIFVPVGGGMWGLVDETRERTVRPDAPG